MTLLLACALWMLIAWGLFALFAALSELYDRAGWRLPAGAEDANLTRRLRVGIVLGGGACLVCVVAVVVQTDRPLIMTGLVAQGALMAAAGVTDLHKFRLPLPATLGGIALALALATMLAVPVEIVALGGLWACVLVLVHARMTGNRMGWGDHLATLWIGLAAPMVGVFAILAGHCATALCARLTGWSKRPVPIGGAWLLSCAMLFALPSSLQNGAKAERPLPEIRAAALEFGPAGRIATTTARHRVLRDVLREAGFLTAGIAFEKDRAGRRRAAQHAAVRVTELAQLAAWAEHPGDQSPSRLLNDLARALDRYDLESIDALSQERARLVDALPDGSQPLASVGREMARP